MANPDAVERYVLGPVQTNCYLVDSTYLIDPGGMSSDLANRLEEAGERFEAVLLTHGHFDHIAGIEDVRSIRPDCNVYCHAGDRGMLEDPDRNFSRWMGAEARFEADATLDEVELHLDGEPLEWIHTPGHSPGSVSYYWESRGILFAGDTLFKRGIGRTDLEGADRGELLESIRKRMYTLPEETRVLPGHGPETTVGAEKQSNPFVSD